MAATYDFTPANGGANTTGTLETTAAVAMYKITIGNGSGGQVDLDDVDGAHGSVYDMILREVAPLMAWAPTGGGGVIHVVVDSHANSAATLLARIENIDGVGNDSTVEAAASFVITA